MKLLLASNNEKKRLELERSLNGLSLEVVTPSQLDIDLVPEENGTSFEENSRIKALAFSSLVSFPVLADDSGLEVDVLDGQPGIHSSRFAGETATDLHNRQKLLLELNDTAPDERGGRFVCALTLARGQKVLAEVRGYCDGTILDQERGDSGFGYDPVFFHPESGKSFAELEASEKDRVSHRGIALRKLRSHLEQMEL